MGLGLTDQFLLVNTCEDLVIGGSVTCSYSSMSSFLLVIFSHYAEIVIVFPYIARIFLTQYLQQRLKIQYLIQPAVKYDQTQCVMCQTIFFDKHIKYQCR